MSDKLKDSIIEQKDLEVDEYEMEDRVSDNTYYPIAKKRVYIQLEKPNNNAQLYNIEEIIDSSIAILLRRKETDGLSKEDWKRLTDIVKMKLDISKMELNTKKTSILEGKTNEEIIELVDMAKASLSEDEDDDE